MLTDSGYSAQIRGGKTICDILKPRMQYESDLYLQTRKELFTKSVVEKKYDVHRKIFLSDIAVSWRLT